MELLKQEKRLKYTNSRKRLAQKKTWCRPRQKPVRPSLEILSNHRHSLALIPTDWSHSVEYLPVTLRQGHSPLKVCRRAVSRRK